MAEMTTLAATIYREYSTALAPGFEHATPGITARFELFYDERFPKIMVCFTPFLSPCLSRLTLV